MVLKCNHITKPFFNSTAEIIWMNFNVTFYSAVHPINKKLVTPLSWQQLVPADVMKFFQRMSKIATERKHKTRPKFRNVFTLISHIEVRNSFKISFLIRVLWGMAKLKFKTAWAELGMVSSLSLQTIVQLEMIFLLFVPKRIVLFLANKCAPS